MMELFPYQKDAVQALIDGKHFCSAKTGVGKGFISLFWAHAQHKPKLLVVTTASKRDVKLEDGLNDFEHEADMAFPGWRTSLSSFEVISHQGLAKWWSAHKSDIGHYAIIIDEAAAIKAGTSSQRGRAFLQIAQHTDCWTGYSATFGDRWIDYYAYFTATGKVKNKTEFLNKFCQVQTYRGFPEIVGYNNTHILRHWWHEIADKVDSSEADRQLPPENHKTIYFKAPSGYNKVLKTRETLEGEFIETTGGLASYLRQLCLTKEKLTWIREYVENLGDRVVMFYNFIATGDKVETELHKALPDAKVWRIDGKHHDIPNTENCGPQDIVLVQWQAGSMGLNLQFISYWVSIEPHYAWSTSEQARGRVRRIGQKASHIDFRYLVAENTIEKDIYKVLKEKGEFDETLWVQNNNL